MPVSAGTGMVLEKTCLFLQEQAWFSKRHACFYRNRHGSRKDMPVSAGTGMVLEKTCLFLQEQAWFSKRHACFCRNRHGSRKEDHWFLHTESKRAEWTF